MKISVEHVYIIVAYCEDGLCNRFPFYVDKPHEMKSYLIWLRRINKDPNYISVSVEKKCVTTYKYR